MQEKLQIKNRILGILIRDARINAGLSEERAAEMLQLPVAGYLQFEQGQQAPSLPQLEVLAYIYNVPIDHFWGVETLESKRQDKTVDERINDVLMIRQRIIGVQLRQLREASGLTLEQVSEETGLSVRQLESVEMGFATLPVNELELVANVLRASISDLVESHGEVGNWIQSQEEFEAFAALPPEMRAFILKPINRSYLELAKRMADMNVDKLRTIAESILEITY